jgi:tRNA G46 methylase TrmB
VTTTPPAPLDHLLPNARSHISSPNGKLEAGARVADVGCGKGASTILMAKAFPKSRFVGFDYHDMYPGHSVL